MEYRIYKLVGRNELVQDGYDTKTVIKHKLVEDEYCSGYNSYVEAEDYIKKILNYSNAKY